MYAQSISIGIVKDLKEETFSLIYDKLNKTYSVQNKSYLELFKLLSRGQRKISLYRPVCVCTLCVYVCFESYIKIRPFNHWEKSLMIFFKLTLTYDLTNDLWDEYITALGNIAEKVASAIRLCE